MNVPLVQHKTIDSVLARGERLDSLVEKSSDLSAASQVIFFFFFVLTVGFWITIIYTNSSSMIVVVRVYLFACSNWCYGTILVIVVIPIGTMFGMGFKKKTSIVLQTTVVE